MKDTGTQQSHSTPDPAPENPQSLGDETDQEKNQRGASGFDLPANRIIRKRIAARTVAVHLSALPPELQALKKPSESAYLTKYDLPDEIELGVSDGERKMLSRDEAWQLADEAGSKLEWEMLPDSLAGKATALFSETGQGVYANYGRPTMDFSGFFHDYIRAAGRVTNKSLLLGPLFIAMDTASAIGFTALGHLTRRAKLANKTVVADMLSTGFYEGSTSWTSAKLGVFTGARAIRLASVLPIPGAHLAAVPVGFLVGAATAVLVKRLANEYKDKAIDAAHGAEMLKYRRRVLR
jgi:hypothetical protein